MQIEVGLRRSRIAIERETFTLLLDASVVSDATPYVRALAESRIAFTTLVDLARKAEIPYALFFASPRVAEVQLKRKMDILLRGVSKDTFSLNSRGSVPLSDIQLIVKDLLQKQHLLKHLDPRLPKNLIVASLRNSRRSVQRDADSLCGWLGIDREHLVAETKKERAFAYLIDCLERHNVFVSQSVRNYMPQTIPKRARFSGICIRDKKVPFIFMNSGEDKESFEPAGRRVLTLMLLTACLACGKFNPVSYDDQTEELIANREFELAEEVLMPSASIAELRVNSLDDVKSHAGTYCVTPSAFLMRARRLHLVKAGKAHEYLRTLREEYRGRNVPQSRSPKAVNALRKYN